MAQFESLIYPLAMVILHGYISSPEGNLHKQMGITAYIPCLGIQWNIMDIYRQAKDSENRASIFPMESQGAKRFSDDRQTTSGIDPSWRLTQGSWAIPPRMREDSALQLTTAPQNVPTFLSWEISSTDTWSSLCRWIVESTHKLVDERIKIPLGGEWWECKLQPESIWRIRDKLHYLVLFSTRLWFHCWHHPCGNVHLLLLVHWCAHVEF